MYYILRNLMDFLSEETNYENGDFENCLKKLRILKSKPEQNKEYDQAIMRCCYLYYYTPILFQTVKEGFGVFLNIASQEYDIWRNSFKNLKILTVGGGCGSDINGVIMSMNKSYMPWRVIDCVNIDREDQWKPTFEDFIQDTEHKLDNSVELASTFIPFDFTLEPISESMCEEISGGKLILLVKFISELNSGESDKILANILHHVCKGALVFFLDDVRVLKHLNCHHYGFKSLMSLSNLRTSNRFAFPKDFGMKDVFNSFPCPDIDYMLMVWKKMKIVNHRGASSKRNFRNYRSIKSNREMETPQNETYSNEGRSSDDRYLPKYKNPKKGYSYHHRKPNHSNKQYELNADPEENSEDNKEEYISRNQSHENDNEKDWADRS